jgi:4-aminobutyrate aminotransferase/(S)-3-amino-2-methylpropionate transaminase
VSAIQLITEVPGPRSRALLDERRRWVARGISEPRHGLSFARGDGARIEDVDGNVFLDWGGGIGALNDGHSPPRLVARARDQLERLQHVCIMTGGHETYVALARRLCELAPVARPAKAILLNSGAEAVENAVKIARRATGRAAVLALDPGFHGRTLLALSLTSKTRYRDGFGPFAPEVYRFPLPDVLRRPRALTEQDCVARACRELHRFFESTIDPRSLACVIFEPVIGEGGFILPPREFILELVRVARLAGALVIADEVQTGFGRTGRLFACEHLDLHADLVCLAKSLSNGLPLSAVVGRADVVDAVEPGGLGSTFGGNPVSCAAALAAIDDLLEHDLPGRALSIGERIGSRFQRLRERFPFVGDARGIGAMRAIEIVTDRESLDPDRERACRIVDRAAKRGLLLLTAGLHGNVIRTLLPLVSTDDEVEEGLRVLDRCFEEEASA